MAEAIYRKYRPMTFADVTGQEHIKQTIQNQISSGTQAHAYLFSGPRGVGKTTIARLLAKSVNCTNRKDGNEPCNTCSNCEQMNAGSSLDVIEIDAASHTGVDNVRDNIIESVRFAPSQGAYKVFIIDEVHMLSTSAFNALLKTLEEPPKHAMFILATTEIHKIPHTILSRCQRFNFHRIPATQMTERLKQIAKDEGVEVDDVVLASVARLSEGCLRDAESLFGQLLALGEKNITEDVASLILPKTHIATVVDIARHLYEKEAAKAVEVLNGFVEDGGSVRHLQDEMIDLVRTIMMTSLHASHESTYDENAQGTIHQLAKDYPVHEHAALLDRILDVRRKPMHETIPQLPLEIAFVQHCHRTSSAPTGNAGDVKKPAPGLPKTEDKKPVVEEEVPQENSENDEVEGTVKERKVIEPTDEFAKEVQGKWGRCCEEVKKKSIALPLALHHGVPMCYEDGILQVGFDMKFHFENMNQPKNTKILQDAINVVMQTDVKVKIVYTKEEEDRVVGELVDAFGGQVV